MLHRNLKVATLAATILIISPLGAAAQEMSKYPDWSGQWAKPAGIGNGQWDITKPNGRGQEPPLTAEYRTIYEGRLAERASGGIGGDPTAQCIPHGMPRMMIGVYPMELVVTPKATYMLSDYNEPRRIFTDGRDWPSSVEPTFNGYSIGRWIDATGEGRFNLLEVETRGFRNPRTFEGSGIPLHEDGESIIKERFYLDQADKNLLHIDITTIDHALTRPWTVHKTYRLTKNPDWVQNICTVGNMHVVVGKDAYFLSADGLLMPSKKDQPPPDLRYFRPRK